MRSFLGSGGEGEAAVDGGVGAAVPDGVADEVADGLAGEVGVGHDGDAGARWVSRRRAGARAARAVS